MAFTALFFNLLMGEGCKHSLYIHLRRPEHMHHTKRITQNSHIFPPLFHALQILPTSYFQQNYFFIFFIIYWPFLSLYSFFIATSLLLLSFTHSFYLLSPLSDAIMTFLLCLFMSLLFWWISSYVVVQIPSR